MNRNANNLANSHCEKEILAILEERFVSNSFTGKPLDTGWNMIDSYSRKEAIEDGVLVDLNQYIPIPETQYKYPIACTSSVFTIIEAAITENDFLDIIGIVQDLIWMSGFAAGRAWETGHIFKVIIANITRELKIDCGHGDNTKPVLTIMQINED